MSQISKIHYTITVSLFILIHLKSFYLLFENLIKQIKEF